MRILMTVSATALMDGINRHVLTIAMALNRRKDVTVAVVTLFVPGELNAALAKNGVKCYSLNAPHGHQLSAVWKFARVMREFQPDIIHAHVMAFAEAVYLRWLAAPIPVVVTAHGISDPVVKGARRNLFKSAVARLGNVPIAGFCYVSEGVRRAGGVERKGPVIYNPISLDALSRRGVLRGELGLDEAVPIVGTACRIAAVKNPLLFTKVMLLTLQNNPRAHAVVIGDGEFELMERMRQMIATSDYSSRFHLLGARVNARELIADLNCFVLTSSREGMPTAFLEAMAERVPVAFMRGDGGLKDLSRLNCDEGPFASEVDQGAVDVCVEEVGKILAGGSSVSERIERARSVIEHHFDIRVVSEALAGFYRGALEAS